MGSCVPGVVRSNLSITNRSASARHQEVALVADPSRRRVVGPASGGGLCGTHVRREVNLRQRLMALIDLRLAEEGGEREVGS